MSVRVSIQAAALAALVFAFLPPQPAETADLPGGFVQETVLGGWDGLVGMTFDGHGRMFVWERKGRVWIVGQDGVRLPQPFLDIGEEVGAWRDYGLLGFALHPDFHHTGYVYLLYVVDHHHLIHHGTPSYDPAKNEYFQASIGRVTRYRAKLPPGESHYAHATAFDPSSRTVLLGESIGTGIPVMHQSHGIGTILFGTDGTLLVSTGDGASYNAVDTGGSTTGNTGSYHLQALAEGIIGPNENVGSYRSQSLDSLCGKVLRIDANTGDGVPSNPHYDASQPRSARSRVWCLGLRNPFRMCLRPGSGSHFPAHGKPGTLFIGDVGWGTWEELNIARTGGENFGWPLFEGMTRHNGYWNADVANLDAPNPLDGQGSCNQPHFRFRDLIQQATADPDPFFPNPCDTSQPLPASIDRFVHARPALDWRHGTAQTRVGIFNGSDAAVVGIGDPASPVTGEAFTGACSVGGAWYQGSNFPTSFQNTYFHADYAAGWIKAMRFDSGGNDKLVAVEEFMADGGSIVAVAVCPTDGCLYYAHWTNQIRRISYVPSGNVAPAAVASSNVQYGPGPLTVQFNGTGSSDPEGLPLAYRWDFGDGSPISTLPNPEHTFDAPAGVPTSYTVTLTVEDDAGDSASTTLLISLNNTPPQVDITSVPDVSLYTAGGDDIVVDLAADVTDAEHGAGELAYAWRTVLHHNAHTHPEPIDTQPQTRTTISPIGCDGQTYYYRITLTVTDAAGLSTSDSVFWHPDCGGFDGAFEGDLAGWSATGLWHRVTTGAPCGDSHAGLRSMHYGRAGSCDYDVGATTGSLTSPHVPIAAGSTPKLSFFHRFEVESFPGGSFDRMHVEIGDGTSWQPLAQWDSTTPAVPAWTWQEYDLSAFIGKTVQVRFRFDSVDGQFNDYGGWYVDDVLFSGITNVPQPPTAAFEASPRVGSGPLEVQFTDRSLNGATSWAWDFDSDGSIDSTARNPVHVYETEGTWTVRLTVTNDIGSSSEIKTDFITVSPPAHDWYDDMEDGPNGWTASGLWQLVTAAPDCGVDAQSGSAQWYFGDLATCTYDVGGAASGSLVSPTFVLGAGAALEFFHQAETESFDGPFDRRIVEIDDGTGWQTLVAWDSADPAPDGWTGETVDLGAYAGKTVRIRFRFDSVDNLYNDFRGWNIDDVTMFGVLSP